MKMNLPHVLSMDISAGCSGFIHGLILAEGLVSSGMYRHVLVIGAEALSRHVDWSNRQVSILFGDGAGAAVVGEVAEGYGFLAHDEGTDGMYWDAIHIPAGGVVEPVSPEAITQKRFFLSMDGKKVFYSSVKYLAETVKQVLSKAGMEKEEISLFVFYQANKRILSKLAKMLKLPADAVWLNLDRLGNTGPASTAISLDEAVRSGRIRAGDVLLLAGFGAGFIWSSEILRWGGTKQRDHD